MAECMSEHPWKHSSCSSLTKLLKTLQTLTNAVVEIDIDRFSAVLVKSNKYTYFEVVDSNDIRVNIKIIYLRAAFRVNLFNRSTI